MTALPMDDRFTMANMAIEAGGKAGIFHVDEATKQYVKSRAKRPYSIVEEDKDARFSAVLNTTLISWNRRSLYRTCRLTQNQSARWVIS